MRLATSLLRRLSEFTRSRGQVRRIVLFRGVNTESLPIQYNITAQHSGRNDRDVTRL